MVRIKAYAKGPQGWLPAYIYESNLVLLLTIQENPLCEIYFQTKSGVIHKIFYSPAPQAKENEKSTERSSLEQRLSIPNDLQSDWVMKSKNSPEFRFSKRQTENISLMFNAPFAWDGTSDKTDIVKIEIVLIGERIVSEAEAAQLNKKAELKDLFEKK